MPSRRGLITSLTFLTASSTPLPPNRLASPSRSSTASCSPVDAPLGTAAVPLAPLASVTSASTVGLPRLSRISRAWMEMIVLMVDRTLPYLRLKSNHRRPYLISQPLAICRLKARGRNGMTDEQANRSRPQPPRAFGKNFERVMDVDRHDRHLRGDGEAERGVLERQQLAGAAASTFGEHDD